MRLVGCAVLVLLGSGCGSSASAPPCAAPDGIYLSHSVERPGGTCVPMDDANITLAPTDTSARTQWSTDHCTETSASTNDSQGGVHIEETEEVHWNADASYAYGTETLTMTWSFVCSGVYDFTLTWLSPRPPPGPSCRGTPPNCDRTTVAECPSVLGCGVAYGNCAGAPTGCYTYTTQDSCTKQTGCTWQ
jgi:hypothetical protein